jgi:hypothetical protein
LSDVEAGVSEPADEILDHRLERDHPARRARQDGRQSRGLLAVFPDLVEGFLQLLVAGSVLRFRCEEVREPTPGEVPDPAKEFLLIVPLFDKAPDFLGALLLEAARVKPVGRVIIPVLVQVAEPDRVPLKETAERGVIHALLPKHDAARSRKGS